MTYRNELDQAHQRIEQLEDELREERAKNEPSPTPEPEIRVAPATPEPERPVTTVRYLEWHQWWPVPVAVIAGIACLVRIHDEMIPWVIRSAFAGASLMSLDSLLRWRNAGERTVLGRLLVVLACIVGAPAMIVAFMVGGPVVGIAMAVVAAIGALIALIRWIAKGD